jgi:hypothetical protein
MQLVHHEGVWGGLSRLRAGRDSTTRRLTSVPAGNHDIKDWRRVTDEATRRQRAPIKVEGIGRYELG